MAPTENKSFSYRKGRKESHLFRRVFMFKCNMKELKLDIPGLGIKGRQNLRAYGFETVDDIRQADREELKAVPGVGEGKIKFLREYARHEA